MWCRRAIQGSSAAVYVAMPDFVGWFGAKRAIRMVPSMFSPRALAPAPEMARAARHPETSDWMTPSQVTLDARAWPASPSARARAWASGSQTIPETSRIGRSNYRLAGQKSLERDVPVVLVVGRIDNSPRIGIQIDERLLTDPPAELNAVRNAGISGFPA